MPNNRVSRLLAAYFDQPYGEYARVVLEIQNKGGLTSEEIRLIESKVLHVDAATIIRQSGKRDDAGLVRNAGA